jgi:prefoldin subunit 5
MPHERSHSRRDVKPEGRKGEAVSKVNRDIKALNSSILVLSQKINYIVRNEKILGRNILVVNKKIKEMGAGRAGAPAAAIDELSKKVAEISERLEGNSGQLSELYSAMERLKETSVKAEQFKELKYVIDSINPLEFATHKDVESIVENKLKAAKKAKK